MKLIKSVLLIAGCSLFLLGCSEKEDSLTIKGEPIKPVKPYLADIVVQEHEIPIAGLEEKFELFFMADSHISLWDDRDAEIAQKAASRYEMFRSESGIGAEESFQDMVEYISDEDPDLLVMGGDILDSAMWASLEHITEILEKQDFPWIYEMGNHDYEYGTEYFSEKCYNEYLPRFQQISDTSEGWQQIEYEDFIVFAVDDQNNQVSEAALKALENIYDCGKTILLISHIPIEPLEENGLWEKSIEVWGASGEGRSRVLLGSRSCVPNKTTGKFLELVYAEQSPIKLILSGHVHFYHDGALTKNTRQIVTGACFNREMVKVTLVPEKE